MMVTPVLAASWQLAEAVPVPGAAARLGPTCMPSAALLQEGSGATPVAAVLRLVGCRLLEAPASQIRIHPPSTAAFFHPHACRNGWCDGQDVRPWVADVTAAVRPAGQANSVAYRGLYRGGAPHPRQGAGFIMMQSSLVLVADAAGRDL